MAPKKSRVLAPPLKVKPEVSTSSRTLKKGSELTQGIKRKAVVLQPAPLEEKLKLKSVRPVCKGLESRRDARGFSTNNSAGRFSLKLLRQQQLGRSGKDQDLGSQKEVSSQKVCEPASGWQEPARVDFSRKEVSEAHHRKHVRQGVQDVHGICRSSRDGPQGLKSGGYDIAGVYEQDVRGRASSLHGRPTHRRLPVPPPRVQQGWAAAHPPILESTERVAKAVSRTKPKTMPCRSGAAWPALWCI